MIVSASHYHSLWHLTWCRFRLGDHPEWSQLHGEGDDGGGDSLGRQNQVPPHLQQEVLPDLCHHLQACPGK